MGKLLDANSLWKLLFKVVEQWTMCFASSSFWHVKHQTWATDDLTYSSSRTSPSCSCVSSYSSHISKPLQCSETHSEVEPMEGTVWSPEGSGVSRLTVNDSFSCTTDLRNCLLFIFRVRLPGRLWLKTGEGWASCFLLRSCFLALGVAWNRES